VVIEKIDGATGALTQIAKTARTTEAPLSSLTLTNFTVTPTSTACKRGDRFRVRVFADDAGTMGSGFTFTFNFDRDSASAGDSYVQFTENLTFEAAGNPGGAVVLLADHVNTLGFGDGFTSMMSQPFVAAPGGILTSVSAWLYKFSAPTDNVVVEAQTDSGGNPSGTAVGTVATVAGASLGVVPALSTWSGLSITLTPGATYHLVFRRSGSQDGSNFYFLDTSATAVNGWLVSRFRDAATSTWAANSVSLGISLSFSVSTYYLTDTAETINPGSATEKKALTTRGGGSVNAVTNTAAGPTAGIQVTASAGGSAVEWYTPPLNAVTLGGKAKLNIRALESSAAANASLKAEIAVTATDGTGATVWGVADVEAITTSGSVGELPVADAARVAWVSGDDTALTAGQRLRFRLYVDDSGNAALVTGSTVTVSYNGATASAAGDSYVILPVAVTEQAGVTITKKPRIVSTSVPAMRAALR
jgi:hypothetical protein